MQTIIVFFLYVLTLIMINPLYFNTKSSIQQEIYYGNESTNKINVENFTTTTEQESTSDLRCIDPGGPPCCLPPLTPPYKTVEECLAKTK